MVLKAPDWRTLSREERDRAFNNGAAVPESPAIFADWDARSAAIRKRFPDNLDLRYGPRDRNRIDFLKAADRAPTLAFIHGGYWQMRAKEIFAFCAEGPMAHGINVALIGYTLAPEASIDEMVAEIAASIAFLASKLDGLGADPGRLFISGWSAGAHLAAMSLGNPSVKGALLISGLYDLEPIRHTYVNEKLGLDEASARRNSPSLTSSGEALPVTVVAGAAELPLMRKQSADYAASRAGNALPVRYEEIPGANHFSILEELASPDGHLAKLARQLVE